MISHHFLPLVSEPNLQHLLITQQVAATDFVTTCCSINEACPYVDHLLQWPIIKRYSKTPVVLLWRLYKANWCWKLSKNQTHTGMRNCRRWSETTECWMHWQSVDDVTQLFLKLSFKAFSGAILQIFNWFKSNSASKKWSHTYCAKVIISMSFKIQRNIMRKSHWSHFWTRLLPVNSLLWNKYSIEGKKMVYLQGQPQVEAWGTATFMHFLH